jgi:cAMP phosphodiesterase
MKGGPFQVYSHPAVLKSIKDHLFNETIWPDFTKIPSEKKPTISLNAIEAEKTIVLEGYKVTPIHVQHPNHAVGYIIEKGDTAVLFTVDTGPTHRIWEVAKTVKNLKAIFTEVSFPNRLLKIAQASDHHTPASLKAELVKMPKDIPIILTHLKPNFREEIFKELHELEEPRLEVLKNDGETFHF